MTQRSSTLAPSPPQPAAPRTSSAPRQCAIRRLFKAGVLRATHAWRRQRKNTLFVAITGSAGKSTAKELLAEILKLRGRVARTPDSMNGAGAVVKTIWRAGFGCRACVLEMGAARPGDLHAVARCAEPDLGVLTCVMRDHYSAFRSADAVAAEKAEIVAATRPAGAVLLNADDPRVLALRERTRARVVTFGLSPDADVRAEDVASAWPDRLQGTLVEHGERHPFRTELCGVHLIQPVLAAAAAARAAGAPWPEIVAGIRHVSTLPGRMYPVKLPGGITMVDDAWKAPWDGIPTVIRFLREARARRKIAVFGHLADYPGNARPKYARVAREALTVADRVIFAGPNASYARKGAEPADRERLLLYDSVPALHRNLDRLLQPGDLVLLKGSGTADHLERLWMARTGRHGCWAIRCRKNLQCQHCAWRWVPRA